MMYLYFSLQNIYSSRNYANEFGDQLPWLQYRITRTMLSLTPKLSYKVCN